MAPVTKPLVMAAALSLLAAACGSSGDVSAAGTAPDPAAGIHVVATTSILGDVVAELVGDDGEVTVLMGPGVDPHAYAPSARDAATLREADLVVANGLQLEESLIDPLDAAAADGVRVFELAPQVDPLAYDESETETETEHSSHGDARDDDHTGEAHEDHEHGPEDPHVWFDPVRMAEGVELLAAELADIAPEIEASEWASRGAAYADELRDLDDELTAAFDAVPDDRRTIVTNHDALGYLAARYDLDVVGTVVPGASTQAESDPRQFADLVETVEEVGITTIFADNTDATRLAEQLASEVVGRTDVEVEVVQVATDALGEPGTPTESYLGLLRETGTTIAEELAAG